MKIIPKTVVAAAIGLATTSVLAETSVFPSSVDDAPALSVVGTTHADRYAIEVAPAEQRSAAAWLPMWAREGGRAQPFVVLADG
jgi:hypothetical protein